MRLLSPYLSVLCLLSGLSLSLPALAGDPDPSLDLFDQGLKAMQAKRFDEGCPKLEQSYQLVRRPGTLFTLAECEAQRNRIATAVQLYEEYLKLFDTLPPADQAAQEKKGNRPKISRDARDKLMPLVPRLTLTLPPEAPQGTVVRRDGVDLGAAEIGVALTLDPGEYTVATKAPGGTEKEIKVKIGQGEKKSIQLEVVLPPMPPLSPSPPPTMPPRATAPLVPSPQDKSTALIGVGAGLTAVMAGIGIALFVASGNDAKNAAALGPDLMAKGGPYPCSTGRFPQDCAKVHQFLVDSDNTHNASVGLFVSAGVVGAATLAYALWPIKPQTRKQQPLGLHVGPIVGGGTTGAVVSGQF